MKGIPPSEVVVAAWGGGVSFAQLTLAKHIGCQTIMLCSHPERLALLREHGIDTIDRRQFTSEKFEQEVLDVLDDKTGGRGVSIFIDNIGTPVHRITLKALARQGVITTCGWKCGMRTMVARAIECINRHIHVHTHYASYEEGLDAVRFGVEHHWMPPHQEHVWSWDEIPKMMEAYEKGNIPTYFPLFLVNPEMASND
jgi:NADPH:quinone reductase-like Zn-dependent oxidoreductase